MTREEFIKDFKERVVDGVYYNMPKDYRKSDAYHELTLDEKFEQALGHSSINSVLEDVIGGYYYDKISECDELYV